MALKMTNAGIGVRTVLATAPTGPHLSNGRTIHAGVPVISSGGTIIVMMRCCTMWAERRYPSPIVCNGEPSDNPAIRMPR